MDKPLEADSEKSQRLEIEEKVKQIVQTGELSFLTIRKVAEKLQSLLDFDVEPHKQFVRDKVREFVALRVRNEPPSNRSEKNVTTSQSDELRSQAKRAAQPSKKSRGSTKKQKTQATNSEKETQAASTLSQISQASTFAGKPNSRKTEVLSSRRTRSSRRSANVHSRGMIPLPQELKDIVGLESATLFEVTQLVQAYIESNNLIDSEDKNLILCDGKLKTLFHRDSLTKATLSKLLNDVMHGRTIKERKKQRAKRANPFQRPQYLSPALAAFLGEQYLSRSEVVKRLSQYVKDNKLQDPRDGRKILFDTELQSVFKCKSTTFFKLQRLLSAHLTDADMAADMLTPRSHPNLGKTFM